MVREIITLTPDEYLARVKAGERGRFCIASVKHDPKVSHFPILTRSA